MLVLPYIKAKENNVMELVSGIIMLAVAGLTGWIYNQSTKIAKLETKMESSEEQLKELHSESSALKDSMFGIDARIDRRINSSTLEMTKFLHELQLTLKELNTTVGFLKEELKELKKSR